MEKRFTISGCSTCLGIAGAILLIAAALICGCTTIQPEQVQTITPAETQAVACTGGAQTGDLIEVDYIGTFDNGTEFDSSYKSGQPFSLILGSGGAIPGFDKALHCMEVNETKKFTLSPEEAYGEYDPAKIVSMPIEFIPAGENATVGDRVTLFDGGQLFQATIADMNATNVTFDLNSPLAGKALTFEVTVRNITPITLEEENSTEKKE
ncbi:peptidylprolyl isomerase [Methanospirillum hungatei]|uniref:FKBP-type peptidyl-prolyl cis-trans isomerase n=1 Tax=Methanospirillum hungatei TaxID=2203 RepID=UPI0026EE76B1|nr:peptidylprolyl isomerase [Methanospirillum hungatei]MCA1914925.1 peptidylprolyl isomerase [Methanospirillum hungatei]